MSAHVSVVAIAVDHAGFPLKEVVVEILNVLGHRIIDHGTYRQERVDFPDLASALCHSILSGDADRGIMLCGTGIGAAIATNKFAGIRACVCHDVYSAHQGVEHDDMNVLCLGGKVVGPWLMGDLVKSFMAAEFTEEEYFQGRLAKLERIELEAAVETVSRRSKETRQ